MLFLVTYYASLHTTIYLVDVVDQAGTEPVYPQMRPIRWQKPTSASGVMFPNQTAFYATEESS